MRSPSLSEPPLWLVLALSAALLAVALGGQAIADHAEPESSGAVTAAAVGKAGFAYLTGFRTFAAAILWNRLEPIMHTYYGGTSLQDSRYMVPTINAVVTLDSDFIDAYYVGAWIVAQNDRQAEGIALARRGVDANPRSGVLRTSYAQMLETWGEDLPAAYEQAVIALGPDMEWRDGIEQHDSYAILRAIMQLSGDSERAAQVEAEIDRLDAEIGDALPAGSHDHDGDGKPDH